MTAILAQTDWGVVLATVVGPIAAVAISIQLDRRARVRERKLTVINALIHGRSISSLAWNQAMVQLPLEFRRDPRVMSRWEDCNVAAREQRITNELMDALVKSSLEAVGFSEALASQVIRGIYRTTGVIDQENLQQNALKALPLIAVNSERSATAAAEMLELLKRGPSPTV